MSRLRILFLDIDGVLNHKAFLESLGYHARIGLDHLDPEAVAVLDRIVALTGVKVVVSSAWRVIFTADEIQALLHARGFRGSIIGATPSGGAERGDEIRQWLNEFQDPVENIVILDDCDDMAEFLPKLVWTSWEYGLKDYHIPLVLDVLSRPWTHVNVDKKEG